MALTNLQCKNFRSYTTLNLEFSSDFVIFYGENGAGKTNILEALSMFSASKGLRKANIRDLVNINSFGGVWNVQSVFESNNLKTYIETTLNNNRRVAKIDNNVVESITCFEDILWFLWVTPNMYFFLLSGGYERRKFMDYLVSGFIKDYKNNLNKLNFLQKERLDVLYKSKNAKWLDVLEEKIADTSLFIIESRNIFIERINKIFTNKDSFFLRPMIGIKGEIENLYQNVAQECFKFNLLDKLKQFRDTDAMNNSTVMSVYKSQWCIEHKETKLDAEHVSTGEQKAFLISLILAAVRMYRENNFGEPILLLDDLMMHLDKDRRKHLINELQTLDVQTFLTGTDKYLFCDIEIENIKSNFFEVNHSICMKQC